MEIIIILSIIIILLILYIIKLKKESTKLANNIDKILDKGIESSLKPIEYNENMISKIEIKANKFIKDNLDIKSQLHREKEEIQSLIGDISHQTKTPISNIILYTELLGNKYNDEYIQILKSETYKLSFLIESLIKSSRLESNIIKLNLDKVDIRDLIFNIRKKVDNRLNNRNINIVYNTDYYYNYIDIKWTEEALLNILDNSIKYSDWDIDIIISNTPIYLKIDFINICDNIPESEYNNLFKRFYRGENALHKEGLGIGLFLTRKIIEEENGYITVNSIDNKIIFSVYLPIYHEQYFQNC